MEKWVKSDPVELEKEDLSRYFYLTRESLQKQIVDESTLSPVARNMLQRIGNATPGLIDSIITDMKALQATDLDDVFKVVLPKIEPIYEDLYIIALSIFGIDKRVPRRLFDDSWTRDISVSIPVLQYDSWKKTQLAWNKMLTFLTGD